jgi:hypothetical protein
VAKTPPLTPRTSSEFKGPYITLRNFTRPGDALLHGILAAFGEIEIKLLNTLWKLLGLLFVLNIILSDLKSRYYYCR